MPQPSNVDASAMHAAPGGSPSACADSNHTKNSVRRSGGRAAENRAPYVPLPQGGGGSTACTVWRPASTCLHLHRRHDPASGSVGCAGLRLTRLRTAQANRGTWGAYLPGADVELAEGAAAEVGIQSGLSSSNASSERRPARYRARNIA